MTKTPTNVGCSYDWATRRMINKDIGKHHALLRALATHLLALKSHVHGLQAASVPPVMPAG
eukprot:363525-Chlamydomonas_euryale.AAC.1